MVRAVMSGAWLAFGGALGKGWDWRWHGLGGVAGW